MGFGKGDHAAGLEIDDVHMHVVAQILRIGKAGGGPAAFGAGHFNRGHVAFIGDDRIGGGQAGDRLIGFADPVKPRDALGPVMQRPLGARRDIGIATCFQHMHRVVQGQGHGALDHE